MQKQREQPVTRITRAVYFIIIFFVFVFGFSIIPTILYSLSLISYNTFYFLSTVALSLSFSASAIVYLLLVDKEKKGVISRLGLGVESFSLKNLAFGVFLFLIIFALEIAGGLLTNVSGVQINTNVGLVFAGAPLWFLVFAAILSPLNEEILFRGLLVPRIGIILSAVLFAIPHITYDSTFFVEVIAAFIFGALSGLVYKRTGSLYPSLLAHILVNTLAVITTFSLLI